MPKFTRQHYIEIGKTIKKLAKKKRVSEYRKWNRIFEKDNPLYDSCKFKAFVGLGKCKR